MVQWERKPEQYVDYGIMYVNRYALLRKAYERFSKKTPADYEAFCSKEAEWLDEYTLFMALKDANGGVAWSEWDDALKFRKPEAMEEAKEKYADDIAFYKMLQYLFFKQWTALKAYANEKGIRIIGDVPIYVAMDSADVWANPTQFYLDKDLNPIEVAGCPPDAFSADGQLWGNPLFRWDVMKKDSYSWWTKRISAMAKLYDIVRIDHFRGVCLTIKSLFTMPTAEAKIVFDDEVEEPISRMIFIAGMNQYCEGGGVPMAPEAVATDGEFSVCCGYGVARWRTFFLLPFLVKGKHTGFKCFDIHNCRKFSVDLEKPMVLHADGEYCGDVTHAEFRCLSGKLNILL